MCGIFGFFAPRERLPELEPSIGRALESLRHRGPDDRGLMTSTGATHAVGMGQTRLSILDLSPAGHQPMVSEDGRYVLVLNGEIYNHRDLRPALEADGVVFRGTSDTETVLHLLIREGLSAVSRMVGMFAFAFWDRDTEELLLVRDRLGKKPLYLARHKGGLAFASEVRSLLESGLLPRQLDRAALLRFLSRGSTRDPDTLIANVRSLPPAHALLIGPHGETLTRYWSLPDGPPPIDWRERLPELLDSAVRMRLLSDRPLGVFLSGGVDSAAIAAVASRHARASLDTFTLSFDDRHFDEADRAAEIARHLRVRHHIATLSADAAVNDLDEALSSQDLPSHDGFNTWYVTRAARRAGLVVALAGTGGDEVFAGYSHFRAYPRYQRLGALAAHLPSPVRTALSRGLSPKLPTRLRKALGLLGTGGEPERIYGLLREMFSPAQIHALTGLTPELTGSLVAPTTTALQMTRLELSGYLVDTQLRDIDVMSMAHGFEVRSPLLDHRLVALMASVGADVKNPPHAVNKRLLVRAAGLPEALFSAPKRGFVLPWERWLRGPLAPWVDHHLAPERLGETGVLDPHATTAMWTSFRLARGRLGEIAHSVNASRILSLVALQSFCVRHGLSARDSA